MVPTFLMTGATRGFGRHAALRLLRDHPGLRLLVVARTDLPPALADHPHVSVVRGDLGSFAGVRAIAEQVGDRPLAGLVANAGIQLTSTTGATPDGYEKTFAVNVLANHLLVRLLTFDQPARVVFTSSDTHFGDFAHTYGLVPGPRWDAPERLATPGTGPEAATTTAGRRAYSTSKLGVVYLAHALARRIPADVYTFNPGLVLGTGLVRDAGPVQRALFAGLAPVLARTPWAERAADAGAWLAALAAGPRPAESGAYVDRDTVKPSSPESYDEAREEELWHAAARLTGLPVQRAA
jgi:NAD(P)-dependent dehydrogenase (short-subunit alcohol dehydrogenase family)